MAGAGRKIFTAGDVLTAAQVQDYLQDQSVMNFATTAARLAAIPAPTEGMLAVTLDDDEIDYYNGTAWVPVARAGAWTSYTPVWSATTTNPVLNNGTITGAYNQIGKTVNFRILMTVGSLTTFGTGNYRWTLPVTGSVSGYTVANGFIYDASTTNYFPVNAARASTTQITEVFYTTNLSGNLTSVLPITWATSDQICFNGTYEAA